MNRIKDIIEGKGVEELLLDTIEHVYANGPVSISDMETLSYIRCYHPELFGQHKQIVLLASGLFYKSLQNNPQTLKELVLTNYKESIQDTFGSFYTPMQADMLNLIGENNVFSFSAPTSTGKSYVFRRLIMQFEHDVVVVVPSRALINEYYLRLTEGIPDKSINILTYVDLINQSHATRNVFIVTPERCGALFNLADKLNVGLFLFDEAQLGDEKSVRGLRYDGLVRRAQKHFPEAKYIFAHPFIANPEAQIVKNNLSVIDSASRAYLFKNVGQLFLHYSVEEQKYYHFGIETGVMGRNRELCYFDPIERTIHSGGSVLIYMSKRKVVSYDFIKEYDRYVRMCPEIKDAFVDQVINELKQYTGGTTTVNSDFYSQFISLLKRGIVIHHGSMPLRTRAIVEQFVNKHLCRLCFSTSTLEQGINMPFDVVLLDRFEASKPLAIKNLIGRAGRSSSNSEFDVGYVVVTSTSNVTKLRTILTTNERIKEQSSLDLHDALDEDFGEYKDAINNGTMDDRFNLPPVTIQRIVEGDGTQEVQAVLAAFFNPDGTVISKEQYITNHVSVVNSLRSVYERYLNRRLGSGEKNVFDTAVHLMMWRLFYHATFKQICMSRYMQASKYKLRREYRQRGRNTSRIQSDFITGYNDLPDNNLQVFSLFPLGTKADDVSYDAILYDTYDYLDKLVDFQLGELFNATFVSYAEKYNDERAGTLAKLLRYGTADPRYIWMMRYGMEFEDIENLDAHIETIDENGIVFKPSIADVSEGVKEVVKRYIFNP